MTSQLLPPLATYDFDALRQDIQHRGILYPALINADTGEVIDGHHRLKIAEELGIECPTQSLSMDPDDSDTASIVLNVARRSMTLEQRTALAKELRARGWTQEKIGAAMGVDQATVSRWLGESATDMQTHNGCQTPARGKLSGEQTKQIVQRIDNGETQEQVAADNGVSRQAVSKAYKREQKKQEKEQQRKEVLEAPPVESITGPFQIILADPPWRYDFQESKNRLIENHYPTMALEDICALEIDASEDSTLYLWATSPKLLEACSVMAAWGFIYKTNMVWVKDKIGTGYHARARHELLLIGTRGKPGVPDPSVRPDSVIEAPRGKHSQKPEKVHELIEFMYPERTKIEIFAREQRQHWAVWGNQVES